MTRRGYPRRAPALRATQSVDACSRCSVRSGRARAFARAIFAFALCIFLHSIAFAQGVTPAKYPPSMIAGQPGQPLQQQPQLTLQTNETSAPITIAGQPVEAWDDMGVQCESLDGNGEPWVVQILPDGIMYQSYMAGAKESRMASRWHEEDGFGTIWDISLGGRAAIWRNGTTDGYRPEGWELEIEGAALLRLDPEIESDLVGTDYRFGVPLIYGCENYQQKFAYYHLSSHAGDEFLENNPGFTRINYVRDELVWGHSVFLTRWLRAYVEAGWAFNADIAEPWEFQFGLDYIPPGPTAPSGDWFWALNAHLREEVDFGGNLVAQVGRAWRGGAGGHIFRAGVEYYNGKSDQFEFYNESEQKLGLCLWYDH